MCVMVSLPPAENKDKYFIRITGKYWFIDHSPVDNKPLDFAFKLDF